MSSGPAGSAAFPAGNAGSEDGTTGTASTAKATPQVRNDMAIRWGLGGWWAGLQGKSC